MSRNVSGLDRKIIQIPAYSIATLDYLDTHPNYFRVQNRGDAMVYCGARTVPTNNQHDFTVAAGKTQMHGEPSAHSKFYIYNPSGSEIECVVLSFAADFDPLVLAFMGLEFDFSGSSIESSNVIEAFNASLPAGNNKIGNVGLSDSLPSGNNKIGNVEVVGTVQNLINSILTALQNMAWTDSKITALMNAINNIEAGGGGSTPTARPYVLSGGYNGTMEYICPSGMYSEIIYISNDSENDLTIIIANGDTTENVASITLKAGEVLNNVKVHSLLIAIICPNDNTPHRYAFSYEV